MAHALAGDPVVAPAAEAGGSLDVAAAPVPPEGSVLVGVDELGGCAELDPPPEQPAVTAQAAQTAAA